MKFIKLFKEKIEDREQYAGIGDIYLNKNKKMKPEFLNFENDFKEYNIKYKEKIVFNNNSGFIIIKNPNSLKYFSPSVRGCIDIEGNLYLELHNYNVHDEILDELDNLGLINYIDYWYDKIPTEYITVQRYADENLILVGESHIGIKRSYEAFEVFLNRAKEKNPNLNFKNELIDREEELRKVK